MKIQNIFQKKTSRKNFFYSLGAGIAGYVVMKTFPFNFIGRKLFTGKEENQKINVKINPFAVSRKNRYK